MRIFLSENMYSHIVTMVTHPTPASLGTTDYVMEDGNLTFRTCPAEKSRLVFQMV